MFCTCGCVMERRQQQKLQEEWRYKKLPTIVSGGGKVPKVERKDWHGIESETTALQLKI